MQDFNFQLLFYPGLALAAFIVAYNIVHLVVRYSSRLIATIVAIPAGLYAAKMVCSRMNWQVDISVYADWLSNLISS